MNVVDRHIIFRDCISDVKKIQIPVYIVLLGINLEKIVLSSKYDIEFSYESFETNVTRLTNQLWKLIPMREHGEDWGKQLDTVILEIAGLGKIFYQIPLFLQLLSKLEGLKEYIELDFSIYRKTVFESLSLLQEIKNNVLSEQRT